MKNRKTEMYVTTKAAYLKPRAKLGYARYSGRAGFRFLVFTHRGAKTFVIACFKRMGDLRKRFPKASSKIPLFIRPGLG